MRKRSKATTNETVQSLFVVMGTALIVLTVVGGCSFGVRPWD